MFLKSFFSLPRDQPPIRGEFTPNFFIVSDKHNDQVTLDLVASDPSGFVLIKNAMSGSVQEVLASWLISGSDKKTVVGDAVVLRRHQMDNKEVYEAYVEAGFFVVHIKAKGGPRQWVYLFNQREFSAITNNELLIFTNADSTKLFDFYVSKKEIANIPVRHMKTELLKAMLS